MDTHWVVGGDWSVEETPGSFAGDLLPELLENRSIVPELQDLVFSANEFRVSDFFKHRFKVS
jgi:hypothetical protein